MCVCRSLLKSNSHFQRCYLLVRILKMQLQRNKNIVFMRDDLYQKNCTKFKFKIIFIFLACVLLA